MFAISLLSDVSEFVGRGPRDGDDPTTIPIRVVELRPVDVPEAFPIDGERCIDLLHVDRIALSTSVRSNETLEFDR
jgi:hypothetical protein